MFLDPGLQMLFRPEEIVLPSGAAFKYIDFGRIYIGEFAMIQNNANTLGAMRTRIVNDDALIVVFTADQQ